MLSKEQIQEYRKNFALIASKEYPIKTKKSELKKFVFNRLQRTLFTWLLEDLVAGIPVRWLIIKSRQMGCSTWIVLFFYWLISFYPNRNCLIVTHEDEASIELLEKAQLVFRTIVEELKPLVKTNNRHQLHFANPNDNGPTGLESKIVAKTADSPVLGASYTITAALLSEFALWAEKKLDCKERLATALQTVPDEPGTFVFIETTARGDGDCKEMWDDPDLIYRKVFLSFVADEEYRREISPNDYFQLVDEDSHKYGDETEVAKLIEFEIKQWYPELDLLNEPLRSQQIHHEIMCRLNWRRYMINNKCQGNKAVFEREYPLTAEQAFAGSGKRVFAQNKLKEIKSYIEVHVPKCQRFRFDSISKKFYESLYGPLKVYESPRKESKYVIGGDPAQGIEGGDPSALILLRAPEAMQVISYEEIIDPDDYALMVFELYKLYNRAYTGIEVNDKGGYLVVNKLKSFGLFNQYKREVLDSSSFKKTVEKYGWWSSLSTKPTMVADMRTILKTNNLSIRDIEVVSQLTKYTLLPNGHMKAIDKKDHLADAYMIALQMLKYVHKGNYNHSSDIPKYSLNWWCRLADQQNNAYDRIGYTPRG